MRFEYGQTYVWHVWHEWCTEPVCELLCLFTEWYHWCWTYVWPCSTCLSSARNSFMDHFKFLEHGVIYREHSPTYFWEIWCIFAIPHTSQWAFTTLEGYANTLWISPAAMRMTDDTNYLRMLSMEQIHATWISKHTSALGPTTVLLLALMLCL